MPDLNTAKSNSVKVRAERNNCPVRVPGVASTILDYATLDTKNKLDPSMMEIEWLKPEPRTNTRRVIDLRIRVVAEAMNHQLAVTELVKRSLTTIPAFGTGALDVIPRSEKVFLQLVTKLEITLERPFCRAHKKGPEPRQFPSIPHGRGAALLPNRQRFQLQFLRT